MQQTIKNTTNQFLTALPKEHVHFTSSDFKNAGFPDYLISRIQLEIERNLAESISLPDSDWVDLKAENVLDAWDQFLSAIRAESRVPASYAQSVIENSVEDVLDQLTQPRQYVLDTLIGNKSATLYQIQGRKSWIVAVPILADALIRYMQRKEHESMTREKAYQVISQVDDKLSENYTPLKWAQHLDPIFSLLNNEVPSALFVRFFKDREMPDFARWIDKGPELLSRTAFIERISTIGMLPDDDEDAEDEPHDAEPDTIPTLASTFVDESNADEGIDEIDDSVDENIEEHPETTLKEETEFISFEDAVDDEINSDEEIEDSAAQLPNETPHFDLDDEPEVTSISSGFSEEVTLDQVLAEESNDEKPLFAKFLGDESESDDNQDEESFDDFEEDANKAEDPTEEDLVTEDLEDEAPKVLSIAEAFTLTQDEPTIGDHIPGEEDEPEQELTSHDEDLDEPEDTPPIIDASSDDEHVIYLTDRAKKLLDILEPNFETFVVEIFLNDELDFYKHLENIASYDQWRVAGRYITRDIFDRNRIDLYSEPAVMFTDAVQEFFDQDA
jgi:hypothetical protein